MRQTVSETLGWCKQLHALGNPKGTAYLGVPLLHSEALPSRTRGLTYVALAAGRGSNYAAYKLAEVFAHRYEEFGIGQDLGEADAAPVVLTLPPVDRVVRFPSSVETVIAPVPNVLSKSTPSTVTRPS